MKASDILQLFVDTIPNAYPEHMLCFFASNAAQGTILPFTSGLVSALGAVEDVTPGYAGEMLDRIAGVKGTGEDQYEAILQILSEVYVTSGVAEEADHADGSACFRHEPGEAGKKNPELEAKIAGHWCAVEVKAPKLIAHSRLRATAGLQATARALPMDKTKELDAMLPRDNPVKDFLASANAKFEAYEAYRQDAFRILVIIWDDFCNEPISALLSPASGLLTPNSFNKDKNGSAIAYPFVDGIIIARYQHQIIRATRTEPLVDGVVMPLRYRHDGFPPKAFIQVEGGRQVPSDVLDKLNATPLKGCMGAEYNPAEVIMWTGGAG